MSDKYADFPEIVSAVDVLVGEDQFVTAGEVMTPEQVLFSLSREGRRVVGKEFPNPVPMEPPIGFVEHEPIHVMMARMIQNHEAQRRQAEEFESEEEANDFDVDDDFDPASPWEVDFGPTMPFREALDQIVKDAEAAKPAGEGGAQPPPDKPTSEAPKAE